MVSTVCDFNGILLIDKPTGLSSNEVLQKIKKILFLNKIGHTGSLDPLATGMLPFCLGEATKFAQYGINANKRYRVIAKFGEQTNTADSDGIIIRTGIVNFNNTALKIALNTFQGKINQIPPMFSAVKYKGVPLYKYARRNIRIPISSRETFIYNIQCIERFKNFIELDITCSKGTYIRTIIDDLGEKLGCGAHVVYLRRLQVGGFMKSNMITLHDLFILNKMHYVSFRRIIGNLLMPIDTLINFLPTILISNRLSNCLKNGKKIFFSFIIKNTFVRVINEEKKFIGVGIIDAQGYLKPKRLLSIKHKI